MEQPETHFQQRFLVRSEGHLLAEDLVEHRRHGDHQRLTVGLPVELVEQQQGLLVLVVGQVVGGEL